VQILEIEVESLVIAWAEDHGWLCPKLQWLNQTGWPDRTFLKNGKVVWIEFKRPKKGRREPKQIYWNGRIRRQGCNAHFVKTVEEGIELLKSYE